MEGRHRTSSGCDPALSQIWFGSPITVASVSRTVDAGTGRMRRNIMCFASPPDVNVRYQGRLWIVGFGGAPLCVAMHEVWVAPSVSSGNLVRDGPPARVKQPCQTTGGRGFVPD
jgi:hypothetical protein